MFEQLIALFTRLVVAVEAIAAGGAEAEVKADKTAGATKPRRAPSKAKTDEKADEPDEDVKPKRTSRKAPPSKSGGRGAKKDPRDEMLALAKALTEDGSDDCLDEFEDLLAEFDAKTVKDIDDEDVNDFLQDLKAIAEKYFDVDE